MVGSMRKMSLPSVVLTADPNTMPIVAEMSMMPRCVWSFFSCVTLVSHFLRGVWNSSTYEPSSILPKIQAHSNPEGIKMNLKR